MALRSCARLARRGETLAIHILLGDWFNQLGPVVPHVAHIFADSAMPSLLQQGTVSIDRPANVKDHQESAISDSPVDEVLPYDGHPIVQRFHQFVWVRGDHGVRLQRLTRRLPIQGNSHFCRFTRYAM